MGMSNIRLSSWLSSGMVFQHSAEQVLFGNIEPGATVRLEVSKSPTDGRTVSKLDLEYGVIFTKEVCADSFGKFIFEFPPQKPSIDEYTFLFVSAQESVRVTNLRCGDVWVFLGSRPFSVPVSKTAAPKTPLKEKALQLIRFFAIDRNYRSKAPKNGGLPDFSPADSNQADDLSPLPESIRGQWITAKDRMNLANISSVAFSMAYHLCDQIQYPVGIVDLSEEDSGILGLIDDAKLKDAEISDFLSSSPPEVAERHTICYQRLLAFSEMNIRGIVFAPDSRDCALTSIYTRLLSVFLENIASILGPKRIFSKKNIPSLILLQLPMEYVEAPDQYRSVHFNEVLAVSRKTLPVATGILGQHDMLLPEKTQMFYIGRRLSYIALGQHFTPKMPSSSPECIDVEVVGNKILLTFAHSGDGLKLAEGETVLRGFCICGSDRVYRPAQSKILHGVRVMVWHDEINEPTGVTYGYYPWPHIANFRSKSDLPVLPFRFDREKARYSQDISFTNCDSLTFIGIDKPGESARVLPVYEKCVGSGVFFEERLNKSEGAASLRIQYRTEGGLFSFSPILRYASMYSPLDLTPFKEVRVDVFNPDEREKTLEIDGFTGKQKIDQVLRWQHLSFLFATQHMLETFEIKIGDLMEQGEIYIDNIRFVP